MLIKHCVPLDQFISSPGGGRVNLSQFYQISYFESVFEFSFALFTSFGC
jgi:hypothetical protein